MIKDLNLIGITVGDLRELINEAVTEALKRAKEEVPRFLTTEEVQKTLGVTSRVTIHNYIKEGLLHPIQANGKNLFCAEQVENDLRTGKLKKRIRYEKE